MNIEIYGIPSTDLLFCIKLEAEYYNNKYCTHLRILCSVVAGLETQWINANFDSKFKIN
jgi:hypothetical protein